MMAESFQQPVCQANKNEVVLEIVMVSDDVSPFRKLYQKIYDVSYGFS